MEINLSINSEWFNSDVLTILQDMLDACKKQITELSCSNKIGKYTDSAKIGRIINLYSKQLEEIKFYLQASEKLPIEQLTDEQKTSFKKIIICLKEVEELNEQILFLAKNVKIFQEPVNRPTISFTDNDEYSQST